MDVSHLVQSRFGTDAPQQISNMASAAPPLVFINTMCQPANFIDETEATLMRAHGNSLFSQMTPTTTDVTGMNNEQAQMGQRRKRKPEYIQHNDGYNWMKYGQKVHFFLSFPSSDSLVPADPQIDWKPNSEELLPMLILRMPGQEVRGACCWCRAWQRYGGFFELLCSVVVTVRLLFRCARIRASTRTLSLVTRREDAV